MNLTNVEFNIKETNQIILLNFMRMLERRNMVSSIDELYDSLKDSIVPNKTIKIKLDNNSNVMIYIINDKVTSITQNSPIDEFLSSNTNLQKFVIIKDPSKKTFKQVGENYPNSEIFFQHEFLEDIPKKDIIPNHQLLNSEEKEELLQNLELKNLKKIYTTDMMSRYFNAKTNDIFRIRRFNMTSGHGIDYRVVVPGKIDLIF
jgi:DNA-directed RNA polymerase subunit H (RpoH/RPB5)